MPKYKIHKRKSLLDKNTTIVNVTKEKSLSETLFGEQPNNSKGLQSGKYRVHERTSVLDKDTKIVTVTKERTLSETLFGTEEDQKQKELKQKNKYEQQKQDNKRYIEEQNQKMINDYNDMIEETNRYYQEQAYNNKVIGEDYTEGISSQQLNKQKEKFDYSNISTDKKKDYLKFIAEYFNAMDKGYSIHFIKLLKKKRFSKKKEEYDGPKYWEIKKDEKEFELNKGYRYEYTSLIIDENGEFWNKYQSNNFGSYQVSINTSFSKINGITDELIAYTDISLERKKIDLSLEKYLNMNSSSRKKLISDLQNNWTEENYKLKDDAIKREKNKKLNDCYNKFMFISKCVMLPLVLLPIFLVVIYTPLFLLIPYVIIISAIYGFIREHVVITGFAYVLSLIATSFLMLIRGYNKAFTSMLIMIAISVAILYLMAFIESKIANKIESINLYNS